MTPPIVIPYAIQNLTLVGGAATAIMPPGTGKGAWTSMSIANIDAGDDLALGTTEAMTGDTLTIAEETERQIILWQPTMGQFHAGSIAGFLKSTGGGNVTIIWT